MGNHEEKALRWRKHEAKRKADPKHYKNPMAEINATRLKQWAEIPDEDWDWVAKLPYYLHLTPTWSAVHAGCMPGVAVEDQDPRNLMRLRYVNVEKGKMASLDEDGNQPANCPHWVDLWKGPRRIAYGHYTRDVILLTQFTIGLDVGCVHGGWLAAQILERDSDITQTAKVKARQIYSPRVAWSDSVD